MKLRDYQIENATLLHQKLSKYRLVYFMAEVRTGKTLTSLEVAKLYGSKKVLFITKKKAISSILDDYNDFEYHQHYDILAVNYESLHKIEYKPDLVIIDEAHNIGAFPKPNKRQKEIKDICKNLPIIYLSGTPAVESSSQWYHQFWVSSFSPFSQYKNFYQWAKDYVNVKQRHLGYGVINDYSDGITKKIENDIRNVVVRFSQENAGFQSKVQKHIIDVDNDKRIIDIQKTLQKNKLVIGKSDTITADTMAKEKIKMHQLSGGTIILDSGESKILSYTKANYIKYFFKGQKLAIFYYYQSELQLIKDVFKERVTTDLDEFNSTDKSIVLQQYSGAEGINLSKANCIVFYNWGFSGVKFIQAIDRMTTKDRLKNDVYFVVTNDSIGSDVLNTVMKKEDYSTQKYKQYGKQLSI